EPEPEPDAQPEPDPPAPPNPGGGQITTNDPGLAISGGISNDWGAGYCMELDVTLEQGSGVTWEVTIDVDGTITNNWESVASGDSGVVTFSGAPYNATLDQGASAHFGFCANR
ncbi:MAG: cellulose binding domain-containing protein, partial [Myxococcota bacterium]